MYLPFQVYKIYPSLLDSWYNYSIGRWETKSSILSKLSRVKFPQSNAMLRGIALEKAVNSPEVSYYADGFYFKKNIIEEIREHVQGGATSVYSETILKWNDKEILLYGIADYVKQNKVIDLKSTKQYSVGKYLNNFQHHCYPLTHNKEGVGIDEFEYLVTDFKEVFKETYSYNPSESISKVLDACFELIAFAHENEKLILDRKFFGE